MFIGYSDYELTFSISGSHSGAAFVTPPDGSSLDNGRLGELQGLRWIDGAQTILSYVEITINIASVRDAVPSIGVVGVANCTLPVGTKIVCQGITQRLTEDARGNNNAWFLPQTTGASTKVRIYNDVNGVAPFTPGMEFGLGLTPVHRVISICTLTDSPPSRTLQDPSQTARSDSGQAWALMRFPWWVIQAKLGRFSQKQAKGGLLSDIDDGAGGTIDVQTLMYRLATSRTFCICDTPNAGGGDGTLVNDLRYDQTFMQVNWMCARLGGVGQLQLDPRPRYTWNPTFNEAI